MPRNIRLSCLKNWNYPNLLNPGEIFIGQGVYLFGDYLFELIKDRKNKYLIGQNSDLKISLNTHGEFASAIESVSLVLEKIIEQD